MKRYWNSFPNFIITGIISLICLIGCGSGGGGGSNNQSNDTNDTTENISISGSVIPPGRVEPSSLRMVSLGDTSSITSQGSYTAKVYDDGVTIIAAIPENKEFGLMNVVATQNTPTYTNKGNPTLRKIISAYKVAENNTLVELNAKTTAVSMVFVSPYFLTNDPEMAGETLSVIENDPKVAYLTTVIESVFNEPDPLSDPALKQALIDAVESVLNTLSIQTGSAKVISTHVSPSSILRLPRASYKTLTTSPYYADQDYITVKAEPSASGYDVSIVTQNGGSIDWIAEVMQLDSSQFNSLNDLQTKASNNRTVYQDEQINTLSELSGEAKSYFRYIDIIRLAFDFIANYAFGDAIKDQITVPSDKDGIYLIRSYSGAWGKLVDPEENSFVRTQIPNGSAMHNKSWTTNLFLGVCDTMGAFVVFDKLLPDDMNKVFMKGIEQAFKELGPVMGNSNTALSDLLRVSSHIGTAMLSELTSQFAQQATKNFFITIARIGEISVSSIIDYSGKASKLGKAADRVFQMLTLATPLETTIVVVGDPLADLADIEKPSPPANLTATPLSSNQIDLSWSTSPEYDVVGYKIYRDEVQIGTSATLNYSDKDLLPSTKYCYTVSAYDAAGNESDKSSISCTTTLSGSTPSGYAWPMLGHGAQHSGRSQYVGIQTADLNLKWTNYSAGDIAVNNALDSDITIGSDGMIYAFKILSYNNAYLSAIDPISGITKWSYAVKDVLGYGIIASGPPAVGKDGTIYITDADGAIHAINATDGKLIWRKRIGLPISPLTIAPDGTIYVVGGGFLKELNPDGTLQWIYKPTDVPVIELAPAIDANGTIYIGLMNKGGPGSGSPGGLAAIHSDGTLTWRFTLFCKTNGYCSVPDVAPAIGPDGTIYIGDATLVESTLYAINPDGTWKWLKVIDGAIRVATPSIAADGTVYLFASGYKYPDSLYSINPVDGNINWQLSHSINIYGLQSLPIDASGILYLSEDDYLYALTPYGTEKWKYHESYTTFSLPKIGSDGSLYVPYFYTYNSGIKAYGP